MIPEEQRIGTISNHYGWLLVKTEGGKYYWSIMDIDPGGWEEIPESLYRELLKFEANHLAALNTTSL